MLAQETTTKAHRITVLEKALAEERAAHKQAAEAVERQLNTSGEATREAVRELQVRLRQRPRVGMQIRGIGQANSLQTWVISSLASKVPMRHGTFIIPQSTLKKPQRANVA